MTALDASLLSGGIAAFAGAFAGVMALSGLLTIETGGAAGRPSLDARLTVGAFLLAGHALTAAALWQAPTIGACMAASLAAGWLGAAAAGLIGLMSASERALQRMLVVAFRALVGFALAAPLWSYLEIIKRHAAIAG